MKKRFSVVTAVAGALVPTFAMATNATAEGLDVTGLSPDISSLNTLALAIAGALMGIWGIRKVIKLVNRS